MKKIIFLIPNLQVGGMERVASILLNQFVNHNIEVNLILYGRRREIFFDISEKVIIHKPSFNFDSNPRLISTLKTFIYLNKRIRAIKPSTIISFGEVWNNFAIMANFGTGIPIFISDRCQPTKKLPIFSEILRMILYKFSRGIIAQTYFAKTHYQKKIWLQKHQSNW